MQIDERSLLELEIFSDRKSGACLLELFVPPQTQGGQEKLSEMLHAPKSQRNEIIAIQESNLPLLDIENLYHPLLKAPTPVSIQFVPERNLLFLTGPNMSGKTTFIKSIGIAVYLAQLGLAVPAARMTLSPFDFLITNIKTEDDIRFGYSYFFSEVKRVKTIAELVRSDQKGLVISDELFKGTNIHDAYEASRSVIQGFSRWKNSLFILSSHLVELQSDIEPLGNILFKYFEVTIKDGIPEYSYRLKDGVSMQRLGLFILEQERIMELLNY